MREGARVDGLVVRAYVRVLHGKHFTDRGPMRMKPIAIGAGHIVRAERRRCAHHCAIGSLMKDIFANLDVDWRLTDDEVNSPP